jgi:hypothetical protein
VSKAELVRNGISQAVALKIRWFRATSHRKVAVP